MLWRICIIATLCSSSLLANQNSPQSYYQANDPYFADQWPLQNSGAFQNSDGKGSVRGADHAHVAEAWQLLLDRKVQGELRELGREVRIAIIDDGFDLHHEDLRNKYLASKNFGGPTIEGNLFSLSPRDFHGTLVTGIAAAEADNGLGIAGACPGCKLIAARISAKVPANLTASQYYQQVFDWVLSQKPDIINCSWGPDLDTDEFFAALMERLQNEGRRGKGTIIVAAAGNDGQDFAKNPLANSPYVITVGASNSLGQRFRYSRYGEGLDVLAPTAGGEGGPSRYADRIFTTDNFLAPACLKPGQKPHSGCSDKAGWTPQTPMAGGDSWEGRYSYRFSHTSAAAPLVSGIIGLILTANPHLTADEVQTILQETADPIEPQQANYDPRGWSRTHGYGRVNAFRAVQEALK